MINTKQFNCETEAADNNLLGNSQLQRVATSLDLQHCLRMRHRRRLSFTDPKNDVTGT